VIATSRQASQTAHRILALFEEDRKRIESLGRTAGSALRVHQVLCRKTLARINTVAAEAGLTTPTVATAMTALQTLGIVRESTGRPRDRMYVYQNYLAILNEGTEPLPPRPSLRSES
jgi:Fic family protein